MLVGLGEKRSNHTAARTAATNPGTRDPFAATVTTTSIKARAASVFGKLARNGTKTTVSNSGAAAAARKAW